VEEVKNIIRFEHKFEKEGPRHDPAKAEEMQRLRRTVRNLLNPEARKKPGRPPEEENVGITNNNQNDQSYALRRLKRDAPEALRASTWW
jgi:hypothetical protein